MNIRTASPEDIALIIELTQQVWPQTYTRIVGKEQVEYMLGQFYTPESLAAQMHNGHKFIIGYENDIPVAFASYAVIEPGVTKLHKLYVVASTQRKGSGYHMLQYIVNDLKEHQIRELRLNVNRFNHPAIAFYKKTGFSLLRDEDIDIGNGYYMNDHVLTLPL